MHIDPEDPVALKAEYWNAYRVKILHKSTDRSLILLVPVIGNIYIGLCDLVEILSEDTGKTKLKRPEKK